jgi:hypothetical protein
MNQKHIVTLRHDNGTYRLQVFTRDEKTAREMACAIERCPESAVVCVRTIKISIYDIKREVTERGGRYFSRENMRANGQTLRDFIVRRRDDGRYFISAPIRDRETGRIIGKSEKIYDPVTDRLTGV